ncbi:hypothetical protein GJ496_006835 [Pomphorhynchus laevis]|nr:hypothetical protein GJ496_006835 [Pomphorhynchus laevis]
MVRAKLSITIAKTESICLRRLTSGSQSTYYRPDKCQFGQCQFAPGRLQICQNEDVHQVETHGRTNDRNFTD